MTVEEAFDFLRNPFTMTYVLVFLPCTLLLFIPRVCGTYEFKGYRMQQFDYQGNSYGCRGSVFNMEARGFGSKNIVRKIVLLDFEHVNTAVLEQLMKQMIGGLIVVLPEGFPAVQDDKKEMFMEFEQALMEQSITMPVYFAHSTAELEVIIRDLEKNVHTESIASAWQVLVRSILADGYQLVTAGKQTQIIGGNNKLFNLMAHIGDNDGARSNDPSPIIVLSAGYDAFGMAPALSYGCDSGATGVAAVLEILRLMSSFYEKAETRPKKDMLFLLTAGDKMNFAGTKHWLEEQLEQFEHISSADIQLAMCFDSLGNHNDSVNVHVSRPPRNGTSAQQFHSIMEDVAITKGVDLSMVHRKINLAESVLNWQHERFSLKKLAAFTISHHQLPRTPHQSTVLDVRDAVNVDALVKKIQVIVESIAIYAFNISHISETHFLKNSLKVSKSHVESVLDVLCSNPRSPQFLYSQNIVRSSLASLMQLSNSQNIKVTAHPLNMDAKDPDFVMYDATTATVMVHRIKPAVFDLILALIITAYLGGIYFFVLHFFTFQSFVGNFLFQEKIKMK